MVHPKAGDVLVSRPTAVCEHEISVIPDAPHGVSPTHDAAVSDGCAEADARGVDAWLTEDQTHVVKISSNRTPDTESGSEPPVVAHQSETPKRTSDC